MQDIDVCKVIEKDFANLAKLAAGGSGEDVRLFLAKMVRKHRTDRPDLAAGLDLALKTTHARSGGPSIVRRDEGLRAPPPGMPVDVDSNLSLIRIFDDLAGMQAPILPAALLDQITAITLERLERDRLADHGLPPSRSAILVGPPGVGKTLSARWIAARIGKPLWVLDLTTVMSSLLGKTGNNLRRVFDYAKEHEAVLLLDEIDAIAKRRSDESDVGELKRLVTAILQEVDAWPDTGLLLAATNHPDLIDPALWRRFDVVLNFGPAQADDIEAAVRRYLDQDLPAFEPWVGMLCFSLQGQSLSEVERTVIGLRRQAILSNADAGQLVANLAARKSDGMDKSGRRDLAIFLARSGTMSHNQISELTGVARDTLRKYAGPSPIKGRGFKRG